MAGTASLHDALASIVGADSVSDGDEYAVDGVVPRIAAAPSTPEQVAELMRYANAERLAVIPWGGGAHMGIGNVPARYDVALSIEKLDGIVEHEPADLTVTCRAGTPLAALQEKLAVSGSMVPLGPLSDRRATVGGVLAANACGPSRHAYGTARDFTIGLKVVTAEGLITKAGGRVVKNAAGYDLCKLYVGSLGTLGVIVEATFKLAPLPRAERPIAASFPSASAACALSTRLRGEGLPLRAVTLTLGGDPYLLGLDVAGAEAAVERACERIESLAREAGAAIGEPLDPPSLEDASLLCRTATLPTRIAPLIAAVEALEGPSIVALPTVGVLYAAWEAPEDVLGLLGRLRAALAPFEATIVLERCPPAIKREIDVFGEPPPGFALMREVKRRFDPSGVLSPGRFVGRL
jgi:glycolate oxidase FAD binding subunit